jgi:PilZ domain-containing protein
MLSALRKFSEPVRPPMPPMVSANDEIEGNALFEALVCEFHWTALQIGAISCCMNAAVETGRTWMLRSCTNLVPVESPVVKVALRSWQEIDFPQELAASIGSIYFELSEAKKLALPLINSAGAFTGPKIPSAKLEQITAVWRRLAEDCNRAVQELEPETRWRLNGLYTANALVLGKFMKEAIASRHGCVNHYGEVALPLLPQRRRTPRYMLLQHCKVTCKGSSLIAFARDISRSGIGISCERDFKLKDPVLVELRNGRRMKGVIVWSKDGKAGIQFDLTLPANDPLISV